MADQTYPVPAGPAAALHQIGRMPINQKISLLGLLALIIAVVVGLWLWSRQPDYTVLFSNIDQKDSSAITQALTQMNVGYQFSEGGGAILVPSNVVHDVRLKLASQGLPKGGFVGFELMENQKLGISQFAEQVNYQRALEGELSRTITSLSAVSSARVHLAIPRQSGFLRDDNKPSASVVLALGGRMLDPAQIAGVVHLVSSSVPQLSPDDVSVIDERGTLLSGRNGKTARASGLDDSQLGYLRDMEESYVQRIETILEPVVGRGNVKAQVSADLDFNQTEQTAETYKPNPANDAAIRSQQISESSNDAGSGPAAGVPGALSNQPPSPATAPLTNPPAPGAGAAAAGGAGGNQTARKDSTVNYELDKTVRHVKQAVGQVKRLSVAVVVNHKVEKLPDGKTKTTPLTPPEMKQIDALVREAMGYNKERGDTVSVANTAFRTVETPEGDSPPIWKDAGISSMLRDLLKYGLAIGLAGYLIFGVIKPLAKQLMEPPPPPPLRELTPDQIAEMQASGEMTPQMQAQLSYEQKVTQAREMAKSDPKMIAGVIKDWVGAEGS